MNLPQDKKIILFDGVCNLCDSSIQFIIKHDKKDIFRFVALQSEIGLEIINHIGIDTSKIDSILLYEPGKAYYYKAQAALKIAKELGGIYTAISWFSILPNFLTNTVYDYIAKKPIQMVWKKRGLYDSYT
jgi:predicted DCC family thiol-disulfide oxidoreductase YuxK